VDLAGFGDAWVADVVAGARRAGRPIWALDLTTDLGVPVFAALSADPADPDAAPMMGFGSHFDPRVALRGALAELGQDPGALGGGSSAPDAAPGPRRPAPGPGAGGAASIALGREPYFVPAPGPAVGLSAHEYVRRADLRDDVEDIVALLRAHGLELLVLDQTRPDIGMPVVKVMVPGLRPMRARFAPGRLFDVPVVLGRQAKSTLYSHLNPVPMPL
jgi:ribosomal protein S12 methylthiotransferase accessory factor